MIPLAALIGLMFMVSEKTLSNGAACALFGKVPTPDVIVVITVAVVTVLTDLAMAVIVGVIISALVFAWDMPKHIDAYVSTEEHGWKCTNCRALCSSPRHRISWRLFSPTDRSGRSVIDFKNARVKDHSALEASTCWRSATSNLGKEAAPAAFEPDCLELLDKARGMIEGTCWKTRLYHPADNRLVDHSLVGWAGFLPTRI